MRYSRATITACGLLLTACASAPAPLPPPEPVVKTVTVDRVITQPCVSAVPALPEYSDTDAALMAVPDSFEGAWNGIALLKGGRAQRDQYIAQLRNILGGCTTVK